MSITRRDFLAASASTLAVGLASRRVLAQQFAAQPATRFVELRRGVGYFLGNGGTIGFVVNDAGALAIDSQSAPMATIVLAELQKRAPKGVDMLINTHHHGDHTGGNLVFRQGVKHIVAHEKCVELQRKVAAAANAEAATSFADVTFTESWKADFGNERIQARYYGAAHTSGDVTVHLERANVVHLGDLLFQGVHPVIDRSAGASVANWITVLERVARDHSNDTIFLAGHARDNVVQCTKADVLRLRDYLTAAMDLTRKSVAAGQSKEDLQKVPAIAGFESIGSLNARLSLAYVLGNVFDEVTGAK